MSSASTDTARMAVLSQIAYLDPPSGWEPEGPLSYLLTYWEGKNLHNDPKYRDAFRIIHNDSYFTDMRVVGFADDDGFFGSGLQAFCFRTSNNETVLAFRGTERCINDSLFGTIQGDKPQKQAAMDFVREMEKRGFAPMRATGHSLGGKLAEYVTVHSDSVIRSDVFNPKNFNRRTVDRYREQAAENEMNRFVTHDENGRFVGGFGFYVPIFIGPMLVGFRRIDWCKNDPNRNFGDEREISGSGHGINDFIEAQWDGGNYVRRPDVIHPGRGSSGGGGGGGSGGRITVNIPELRRKVAQFKEHLRSLERFLRDLDRAITAISRVAWVSPLSMILLRRFKRLYRTIEISLRIVEKYIFDLEEAIRLFIEVENRAKQRVGGLNTDVFGS